MSESLQYSADNEAFERERLRSHLEGIIEINDARLQAMRPEINHLMEVRHKLYTLPRTFFDVARPTLEQMYDEPTYNDVFVYGNDPRANIEQTDEDGKPLPTGADLAARNGAEFHKGETYDEGEYAEAILEAADRLGFVKDEIIHANDPIGRELGIADSEGEPIGHVDAVVVAGAAGLSNPIRMYDMVRDFEEGRVETDLIILASCNRPVREDERERLEAKGFPAGATEFESMVLTFNKFTGAAIDPASVEEYPVRLKEGNDGVFTGRAITARVMVAGAEKMLVAIDTPYDPERVTGRDKDDNAVYAVRANTDETFVAALPFLPEGAGTVLIKSHDTWTKGQGVIGEQIFGVAGKNVIATGPRKLDRVVEKTGSQGNTYHALTQPEAVVDEMAKTYAYSTHARIKASTALSRLTI